MGEWEGRVCAWVSGRGEGVRGRVGGERARMGEWEGRWEGACRAWVGGKWLVILVHWYSSK